MQELTSTNTFAAIPPERMQVLLQGMQKTIAKKAAELTKELAQNFPEYGCEEWISCTDYNYEEGKFTFKVEDPENEGHFDEREVTTEDLMNTIPLFWLAVQAGECSPYGLTCSGGQDFWDACNWDQPAVDCLLQYHFYKECVFG